MRKEITKTEGITLVALVVTVVVLMILAGLTVTLVLGQNGIMGKAKEASAQNNQATAEENLKMMLAEYYTNKQTGDTETLKDYLDKEITAGKIDSEQANGSNYDVTLEGYICTLDSNTLDIINTSKYEKPEIVNIKVGDFVNYTAGTWTQDEINSLGSLYSGVSLSTNSTPYTFGGFKVGDNRDNSITPYNSANSNKYSSGWRVLDLNTDGSIKDIVHAGTPEGYFHADNSITGANTLTSTRNWSMYVNNTYATSAHCMTYNEAYSITGNTSSTTNDLRTTDSTYWLASYYDTISTLWCVYGGGVITNDRNFCFGVRPVVSLKSGIQITGGSGTWADPYQMK